MLTIDEIRDQYCPGITEDQLARFREQSRIAKGPSFRMTMEYPTAELTEAEEAQALAQAEYDDDMGNAGVEEGTYITLGAQTAVDAIAEAERIWQGRDDGAAIGYAVWRNDWGCVRAFSVERGGSSAAR
jgi:hypothetical protein